MTKNTSRFDKCLSAAAITLTMLTVAVIGTSATKADYQNCAALSGCAGPQGCHGTVLPGCKIDCVPQFPDVECHLPDPPGR